jgi:hypothetical protein
MNSFKIIRQATREGASDAMALQAKAAVRIASLDSRAKTALVAALTASVFALNAGFALAASACGGNAADTLTKFIGSAATFMMALGGAGALLMFAVGACFIIFGGTQDRVRRGMTMIKNAVIGLVVLAVGAFIKFIVLAFLDGATTGKSDDRCVKGDL